MIRTVFSLLGAGCLIVMMEHYSQDLTEESKKTGEGVGGGALRISGSCHCTSETALNLSAGCQWN